MLSEFEARRAIIEIGRRIWERGYVAANDGNLSVRIADDRIIITPTGRSKGFLELNDLVTVNLEGKRLSGGRRPTSELAMHLLAYRMRPDVGAVVHAHPPKATAFAVAGLPLAQCILPEVIVTLGKIPLTEYATPSTGEVPDSIHEFIGQYDAILLRNHGVLTLGADIEQAYFRLETVEHFAEITLASKALGGATLLTREDVRKLLKVREELDIATPPDTRLRSGVCETAPGASGASTGARAYGPDESGSGTRTGDEEEIIRAVLREVKKALADERASVSDDSPEHRERGEDQ